MRHEVNVAKWILLVFVCCELVSLFIAFIMRFCVDPEGHYSNFDDEEVCRSSMRSESVQTEYAGAGMVVMCGGSDHCFRGRGRANAATVMLGRIQR